MLYLITTDQTDSQAGQSLKKLRPRPFPGCPSHTLKVDLQKGMEKKRVLNSIIKCYQAAKR